MAIALLLLEHPHEVLAGEVGAAVDLLVALERLVLHRGQRPTARSAMSSVGLPSCWPAWKNSGRFWRAQSRPGNGEKKMPPFDVGAAGAEHGVEALADAHADVLRPEALGAGLLGELDVVDRGREDEQHLHAGALHLAGVGGDPAVVALRVAQGLEVVEALLGHGVVPGRRRRRRSSACW